MFCDLGGILGLYAGFSLLTIFEFFEFFASLLWICVVRLYRGPTVATASVGTVPSDKNATKMQSSIPPASDGGLAGNDQFQLLPTTKKLPTIINLPNDNCEAA